MQSLEEYMKQNKLYDTDDNSTTSNIDQNLNLSEYMAQNRLYDKDQVELNQPQSSFMDNIKSFGGKVKNAISNMGISNPYEDIARQTLKGGIETNVFQPNQYGVTPLEGIGNIASDIGSGINKFAHAPLEFAKQLGRDTVETGKNIVHNPALLKDVPNAIMTGLKDLPFDVAQAVVDLPETIASSYNNRPFERQVNVPNSDEFAENMATNLLNIFLNEEQKRRNQELHQQRLQQIAQEREKINQLPIAQTMGAFMLPASNIAKVAKAKGIADSIKTGAKWGLATTSGSVEDRTIGTLGGGAFGGTLHAGIKTAPKIAKGVKNVSAEIVDRLNPENYEQVIDSKLVKKGTGLSQRTVYEPEIRYEYKPKRHTYNVKDASGKERISGTKTDFTMGESGELKTPVRPTKKKYGVSTNVQYTPNFTIEKVAPSVFAKQQAKAEVKEQARKEQMENLAPNVMAEQEAKAETKEQIKETQQRGKHTKEFNKGDIIRDIYQGHVYEVVEPDKRGMGHLRNVDTNEIETLNAHNNAHFEKYEYNPEDLIEVYEFKYEPKAKRGTNADNYMFSRQSVVDAYNEYVKNPNEANKEKYEDVSGTALKEFYKNEEAMKNGTFVDPQVENTEKGNTNDVVGNEVNTKENIIPIDIDENSVPKFEKISQLKNWIAENLNLIGNVTIKQNNRVAQFSKTNISRSMKGINRSEIKRNSYSKLRELVENAIFDTPKPSDERHPNINGQEIYYNKFNYKGKTYEIEIAIDIPKSKNTPYTYAGHKIKVAPAATRVSSKELISNRPSANNIIPQNEEKITEVNKKSEPKKKEVKKKESYKLEDAGEFLQGNRKQDTSLTWDELKDMNDLIRAKNTTKAKVYPKPALEELQKEGFSDFQAAVIQNVYNKINAKPASGYNTIVDQRRYVDMVNNTMKTVKDYIKNHPDEFDIDVMLEMAKQRNSWSYNYNKSLFETVFPDSENKKTSGYSNIFRLYPEYNKNALVVGGSKFTQSLQLSYSTLKDIAKVIEGNKAVKDNKTGEKVKKEKWEKQYIILEPDKWNKDFAVANKKSKQILGRYESKEEAEAAAKKVFEIIERIKEESKKANYERDYVERRENGKDIKPEELKDEFGFRGVNFGNWVNQKERQNFINYTYDSLLDLAEMLNLPPKALSLNGQLGLAFGAQGHGGKAAGHYIPAYKEINMTKEKGAGTLAHEWWHALDNYFGNKSIGKDFSENWALSLKDKGELRKELFDALKDLHDQIKTSPFTEDDIKNRLENLTKRCENNIQRYADYIKNEYKKAQNSAELNKIVDDLVENKEKYKTKTFEDMYEIENKFFELLPKNRDTLTNRGQFSWLTSEIRRLNNVEELAGKGANKSEYLKNSELLDAQDTGMGKGYWTEDTEMGARAFTTYLLDKMEKQDIINQFLTRPQDGEVSLNEAAFKKLAEGNIFDKSDRNIYIPWNPENPKEKARIFKAFDKLFDTIKTRDTEKGVELYDIDIPEFMKDKNINIVDSGKDIDLTPIYESISRGIKGKDLAELLPEEIAKIINEDAKSYTFGEMITKDSKKKGVHSGIKATIKLNLEAIGNNPYRFIEVLTHEVKHANQHKTYLQIMAKPKNTWTLEERIFIAHYNNSKRVNKTREKYYNKHKDLIDNFKKDNFYSEEERANAIFQLKDKERSIVLEYDKLFENYWNSFNEVEARAEGTKNAKGYRKESRISRLPKTKQVNTRLAEKGDLGSNSRNGSNKGEYSTEPSEYRQVVPYKKNDIIKPTVENTFDFEIKSENDIIDKVKKEPDKIITKILTPISSRLADINPILKYKMRKFEYELSISENKYSEIVKPFIKKLERIEKSSKIDYLNYDIALKNGDIRIIKYINNKYGLSGEYNQIKNLLEHIKKEATEVGLDFGEIEDYFPRKVINSAKLIEEYSKNTFIKNLLKEIDPNNTLSNEEKINIINSALRGYNGAIKTNSTFTKNRKINKITKELNKYYKDSKHALVDYITSMNNSIQIRKFFGGKSDKDINNSIGSFVKDLVDSEVIKPSQEAEIKELLTARFNQKGVGNTIGNLKNFAYMMTMGNMKSALRQIGDFGLTCYKNGLYNSLKGLRKSITNEGITLKDLGIDKIAQEFESDLKTGKVLNNLFKLSGLTKIDSLAKESFINASFDRLQIQAKNTLEDYKNYKSNEFYNYLKPIFDKETYQVLKDLSEGNISDNVKYLLFSEISDFQPISLSEMPQNYLTSGNGRIAYMLKTYSIKIMDVFRNECFKQIKSGNKESVKKGIKNLIRLATYLLLFETGARSIIDFIQGREFDINDSILDTMLSWVMFSKYQYTKSKKEGIAKTIEDNFIPPVSIVDDLWKDLNNEKLRTGEKSLLNAKTIKDIPLVGDPIYWWFGGGKEVRDKEFKENRKKEYINALENNNEELEIKTTKKMKQNNYDEEQIYKVYDSSIKSLKNMYSKQYFNAIKHNNEKLEIKITKKMQQAGFSDSEIQNVYDSAYSKYEITQLQ